MKQKAMNKQAVAIRAALIKSFEIMGGGLKGETCEPNWL